MSNLGDVLRQVVCIPKHIPDDWQFYKLTDICNPKQWKTISATEMTESGYPVFGANGFVGFYYEYNHEHEAVAITCRGNTCGTINRIPPKTYITGNSMALDDIKKNVITQDYLYYALKYRGVGDSISGSAQPQITGVGLRSIELPAPPLPEQQKIAAILSSVDDVIEKTRAQIDKLKDLKTGMMQELLTKGIGHTEFKDSPVGRIPDVWAVSAVSDVVRLASGGTPDRRRAEYWNGTIPWVKTGEVNYRTIHDTDEKITELGLSESSARLIPAGAILMAMYGQGVTRGKVAKLGVSAAVNQACLAMIPNDRILGDFLYYYFSHEYFSLRSMVQEGAQKNLSMSIVKEILLPVPPLREQEKIVNALQSIDKRIQIMRERLMGTIKIKKALMQDLLTGKVRVNVD